MQLREIEPGRDAADLDFYLKIGVSVDIPLHSDFILCFTLYTYYYIFGNAQRLKMNFKINAFLFPVLCAKEYFGPEPVNV